MGLLSGIVGGALGIGAGIFGGISASKAMKKVKKNIESRKQENENWYDRRYNEDATQRADAQRMLTKLNEGIRQRNQAAAGRNAVMGGTDEALAAEKAQGAQAMADAASQIAAAGEARKDAVEQQYLQRKDGLDDQLNQIEIGKAQAVTQAAAGVAEAGANIADLGMDLDLNKKKP